MEQPIICRINKCSFCRSEHHYITNCELAYQAAQILHNSIINIINIANNNSRSSIFITLKDYLKLHTLKELKLLVRIHGDIVEYANHLFINNLFNINARSLCLKGGLVKILTLYYFNKVEIFQTPTKKFYIHSLMKNNIEENKKDIIQCPICLDDKENLECVTLNCNHSLCNSCLKMYLENLCREKTPCCSLCRESITEIKFTNVEHRDNLREKLIT